MISRYEVLDPRPFAVEAPYTYFLPLDAEIAAIGQGDQVKAVIRTAPPSKLYDAERLWLRVKALDGEFVVAELESTPLDMPHLSVGAEILMPRNHAVDVIFANPDVHASFAGAERPRQYWERCLVDQAVLDGTLTVEYLYREAPESRKEGHTYPDSGWRIRGDTRGALINQIGSRKAAFVALGAVLNRDDSWLHLIDAPEGSRFEKDYANGTFVAVAEDCGE